MGNGAAVKAAVAESSIAEFEEVFAVVPQKERARLITICNEYCQTCFVCSQDAPEQFQEQIDASHRALNEQWQRFNVFVADFRAKSFLEMSKHRFYDYEDEFKATFKRLKQLKHWRKCPRYQVFVNELKAWLLLCVLLSELSDPCIKPRHWEQVSEASERKVVNVQFLTVGDFFDSGLHTHSDEIEEICDNAKRESKAELTLNGIRQLGWHSDCVLVDIQSQFEQYLFCSNARGCTTVLDEVHDNIIQYSIAVKKCLRLWDLVHQRYERLQVTFGSSTDIRSQLEFHTTVFDDAAKHCEHLAVLARKQPLVVDLFCMDRFEFLQDVSETLYDCEVSLLMLVEQQNKCNKLADMTAGEIRLLLDLASQLLRAPPSLFPVGSTQRALANLEYLVLHFGQCGRVCLDTDYVVDWHSAGLLLPRLESVDLSLKVGMAWSAEIMLSQFLKGLEEASRLPRVTQLKVHMLASKGMAKVCDVFGRVLVRCHGLQSLDLLESPALVGHMTTSKFQLFEGEVFEDLRTVRLKADWMQIWSSHEKEKEDTSGLSEEEVQDRLASHAEGLGCLLKLCPKLEYLSAPGLLSRTFRTYPDQYYKMEIDLVGRLNSLAKGLQGALIAELKVIELDCDSTDAANCDLLSIDDGRALGIFLGSCCPRVPRVIMNTTAEERYLRYKFEAEDITFQESELNISNAIQSGYDEVASTVATLVADASTESEFCSVACLSAAGNVIATLDVDPQVTSVSQMRRLLASHLEKPWSKVQLLLPSGDLLSNDYDDVMLVRAVASTS